MPSAAKRCGGSLKQMGCSDLGELLFAYRQRTVVPGICTDSWCDGIRGMRHEEEGDFCPDCRRDSVQSILIFAVLQ